MAVRDSLNGIDELQALQAAFDASRGFDFDEALGRLEPATLRPSEATLRRLEFIALAICGEAGELANVIKKARRSAWLDAAPEASTVSIGFESADVLAYLLKLANVSGTDLRVAYLQTICRNCLRFPSRATGDATGRVVTLCAPPGAGAGEVFDMLASAGHASPQASDTLAGPPSATMLGELIERTQEGVAGADETRDLILPQDPAAYGLVYGTQLFESGEISSPTYGNLLSSLARLEIDLSRWRGGRLVFALDAPPQTLRERVDGAAPPSLTWFTEIHLRFKAVAALAPRHTVVSTTSLKPELVVALVENELRRPMD
jgi:NTP pyrophosphatase (non-canonical NTP hydrolase)